MIYTLKVTSPAESEPVTVEQLKAHLRLNDDSEDSLLSLYISSARQQFESRTNRAVMATGYRQYFAALNAPVALLKPEISSIDGVFYYDTDDNLQEIVDYHSDLISSPGKVWLDSYPSVSVNVSPAAYIDFTCGWETADDVPETVKLAIKLLAANYYENRNSHSEKQLKDVPLGFQSVCDMYKTNLISNWS